MVYHSLRGKGDVARWSSGQDGGLSRRKREFDSPTGHHQKKVLDIAEEMRYDKEAVRENSKE